jgi:hypothetical protein
MSADALTLLRDADPARDLEPLGEVEAERLRLAILASARRAPSRRRPRLALIAALAAVALLAAGFTAYKVAFEGSTAAQVRDSFAEQRQRVPLPPGATWADLDLEEQGVYAGSSDRWGLMLALGQAECAWFGYWVDGGAAQRAEAIDGMHRLRTLMPLHPEGALEDVGGYSQQSLDLYDGWVAAAARGDGTELRQFLRANC